MDGQVRAAAADAVARISLPAGRSPSPSPDGARLAYVGDGGGRPQLWVASPGRRAADVVLDTGPDVVEHVAWSPRGDWIAVGTAPSGGNRTRVLLVRPDGTGLRHVAGGGDCAAVPGRWSRDGAVLCLTETSAGPGATLVCRMDPDAPGRSETRVAGLVGILDADATGRRLLVRCGPRGRRRACLLDTASGALTELVADAGESNTDLGRLSPDGATAWLRSDLLTDLPALLAVPVRTDGTSCPRGEVRLLAARGDGELDGFDAAPGGGELALLWNREGWSRLELVDPVTGARRRGPVEPAPVLSDVVLSPDGARVALAGEGTGQPPQVWLAEVAGGWFRPVPRRPLPPVPPPAVQPVLTRFRAGDGLALTGWLFDARPPDRTPGPAVVWLHGGPEWQERPGWTPLFEALAAAGISVLGANVRGSTGFGRAFVEADNGARRFAAIDDVAACVAHLVASGVADPARVGCAGRSYGGYLTLAALTRHPELFAAGVDVCGMADFASFYARTEPWIAAAAVSEYGDPVADADLLRELSPLHRMDRLAAPLLVVHGTADTNVPVFEAEQALAAARAAGVATRYLLADGEGHEFAQRANRERFVREVLDWLATHLGTTAPAGGR